MCGIYWTLCITSTFVLCFSRGSRCRRHRRRRFRCRSLFFRLFFMLFPWFDAYLVSVWLWIYVHWIHWMLYRSLSLSYFQSLSHSHNHLPLFLIYFHTHSSMQVVGNKPVYIIAAAFRVLIMHRSISIVISFFFSFYFFFLLLFSFNATLSPSVYDHLCFFFRMWFVSLLSSVIPSSLRQMHSRVYARDISRMHFKRQFASKM